MKQIIKPSKCYIVLVKKGIFKTVRYYYTTKHEATHKAEKYLTRGFFVKIEKA